MLCPGWMLGVIEGNAEGVKGWDVANVFPGGGGNWGGSYLTVPTAERAPRGGQGARRLADRARAAGQGLREGRRLPEPDRGARRARTCSPSTNAFFNDAPTGQIFADRAKAVTVHAVQGPDYSDINDALQQAADPGRRRHADPQESWDTCVADVEALG